MTKYVHIVDPASQTPVNVESRGALEVSVQDPINLPLSMYAWREDVMPALTGALAVDDINCDIDTNAGVTAGDAIVIMEDTKFFQSTVISTTATNIVFGTPCDQAFTVAAIVSIGPWNMAVDGSSTPEIFSVRPPPGASWDVVSATLSMFHDLDMDGSTFAGIVNGLAYDEGLLLRISSDLGKRNIGYFVNNIGFEEWGWKVTFLPVNKKADYSMLANLQTVESAAIVGRISGKDNSEIQIIILADLTDLSLFAGVAKGHLVED